MKIAVCSDELCPVNDFVVQELKKQGHEVLVFGAIASRKDESWVSATVMASEAIVQGKCDEGIFFCWTGTGTSMAANKISGIRAALCTDAETARGARIWNHANVLVLSNRLTTIDIAKEILKAWFDTPKDSRGEVGVSDLIKLDSDYRKK